MVRVFGADSPAGRGSDLQGGLTGEQSAVVDRALFDAIQARLPEQVNSHNTKRMKSEALLIGRIFDDRGNRMSPGHARKGGFKYGGSGPRQIDLTMDDRSLVDAHVVRVEARGLILLKARMGLA